MKKKTLEFRKYYAFTSELTIGTSVYYRTDPSRHGIIIGIIKRRLYYTQITVLWKSGRSTVVRPSQLGNFDKYLKACSNVKKEASLLYEEHEELKKKAISTGKLKIEETQNEISNT